MSGGFFRGTSADQDTRFSNKQAKLLKSQKFPPELDHLVDVTKVKMDVIRPWIANRVTELLGFEDEVLINFIYGLLDGKDVNGKEVQIQITGFMEKNTGRFMKELWSLLLSAQKNASGVPQQFLDAKEEEIRKKKVESDRITNEIQKKKEVEQVKSKSMDGELDASKSLDDVSEPVPPNHSMLRTSDVHPKEEKDFGERNGSRDINSRRRTSVSAGQSPSSERINPKSMSKSFSNSRSYSDDRNKSRSISISPESRRRSISPVRRYRSPRNHSISPNYKDSPRRPRSSVRRSPYSRRRSPSHSWHRSPSPRRRRSLSPRRRKSPSPWRRRSPSPRRRKSPSLIRRRSPALRRRRSPSPIRHRSPSPVRCRSPSPVRYRSSRFVRRRSPSPMHHRSPSPVRRRLPVPIRRRSPTPSRRKYASPPQSSSPSSPRRRSPLLSRKRSPPHRSPKHHRRSPLGSPGKRNRSPSPYKSHSPTFRTHRSLSRDRVIRSNGVGSRRHQVDYESERDYGRKSPIRHASHREEHKGQDSIYRQRSISLMSPQREPRDQSDVRQKKPVLSPSPERSPSQSEHSLSQKTSPSADRRSPSLSRSPMRQKQEQRTHYDKASPVRQTKDWATGDNISESDGEEQSHHARDYGNQGQRTDSPRRKILDSPYGGRRNIHKENMDHSEYSTERVTERQSGRAQGHRLESTEAKKKEERKSEKTSTRTDHHRTPTVHSARTLKESDYGPGRVEGVRSAVDHATNEQPYMKQLERDSPMKRSHKSYIREDHKVYEKQIQSHNIEDSGLDDNHDRKEYVRKPLKRVDHNNRAAHDSVSEENEKNKSENVEKRKHKRAGRHEMTSDDDTSYDSHIDERKEAKRRRKEEKRLRKEERRRRREERRRRREEKRSSKLKSKTIDTVTPPSDIENIRNDADDSDADAGRKESCPSDAEETESEQKKLEIELRKKALESLRAKKAVNP